MQTLVDQIEAAMEATPTVVLALWSRSYAQADGNTAGVRAGVRGEDDWQVELDGVTLTDAQYLEQKYGPNNTHYTVDDDSVTREAYLDAVAEFERELQPLTISLAEVLEMCIDASKSGEPLTINGATWLVQR